MLLIWQAQPTLAPSPSPSPSPLRLSSPLPLWSLWPWLLTTALAGLPLGAQAQSSVVESAATVVVTGSVAERQLAEAPYAVGVVGREALRDSGPGINLSEAMARVPGLVVANRSNYAQDLQISSRGFGARAGFGVRGLRLLADGIPASGPDGQGQVAQFDLANAQRVEVLRGPFSVLYGNSSGGVISLISAPVRQAAGEAALDVGSFGLRQLRASVQGPLGPVGAGAMDLRLSLSGLQVDGFRPRSQAQRRLANLRLGWVAAADTVTVLAGAFSQPAQDPLGLTREQFNTDPLQTTPQAAAFDTRKLSTQQQGGVVWKHRFADSAFKDTQLMAYKGQRTVTQWLAIAAATQANVRHGGGVVDFDRDFGGLEARARWAWDGLDLLLGAALDDQRDARRGYENFIGTGAAQVLGVTGRLRRDENNRARATDVFAQAEATLTPTLFATLGLRSGQVKLSAVDAYLSNGDDSGALKFDYNNPVAGLRWQPTAGLNLHASVARGFEAPTLGELAYRADASSGLNLALRPQTSRQWELGAKWRGALGSQRLELDLALFEAQVQDEIGVATNAGGRSAFQNVGRTQRRGVEVAAGWSPHPAFSAKLALTQLEAIYRDNFLACAGIPCAAPTVRVASGNLIAGTQPHSVFADLVWRAGGWGQFGLEIKNAGRTAVNDSNSDFAAAYTLANLRWSLPFSTGFAAGDGSTVKGEWLLRVDNAGNRRHVGSVIVNEANGRFFETGAPRSWLLALRLNTGS